MHGSTSPSKKGEFAKYTPKKLNNPEDVRETMFEHSFTGSSAWHDWIYFKKTNWIYYNFDWNNRDAAAAA